MSREIFQEIKVPIELIFNGRRPLWCLPTFYLYDNDFDEVSSKIFQDWVDRRPSNKKLKDRKKQFEETTDQGERFNTSDGSPTLKAVNYTLDRFQINDGHNRAGILTKKGHKYLILACDKELKKKWGERNARVEKEFQEILSLHSKPTLYQSVDMLPGNPTERSSYDRIKYIAQAIHSPATYQIQPKKTGAPSPPKKILDIGCNMGFFTNWLSRMNHKAIGIDTSKNKILFANKLARAYRLPTIFHNVAFQDFDEEVDGMLDLSCCWHFVLKKRKDSISKDDFADKISRCCKGFLIAETKSDFLDEYIELVTTKTHLSKVSVIGETKYFQDPGGRKLVLFLP